MPTSSNKPTVLSLFSGAGCFDLGFEAAGFRTVLTTDLDGDCCKTISKNRNWKVVHSPIEAISSSELLNLSSFKKRQLDVLIGGPPCQPYSKSAFGSVGEVLGFEDERAHTVKEYVRAISTLLPKVFVIENVPQFITGKNEALKRYLERAIYRINSINRTNYRLSFLKINVAWYGVPQLRERLFLIASRDGDNFRLPPITHLHLGDPDLNLMPFSTAWDAIGHLAKQYDELPLKITGKWKHLLGTVPACVRRT